MQTLGETFRFQKTKAGSQKLLPFDVAEDVRRLTSSFDFEIEESIDVRLSAREVDVRDLVETHVDGGFVDVHEAALEREQKTGRSLICARDRLDAVQPATKIDRWTNSLHMN